MIAIKAFERLWFSGINRFSGTRLSEDDGDKAEDRPKKQQGHGQGRVLQMAGPAVRGDGEYAGGSTVHSAADPKGSVERGRDPHSTGRTGRRELEVRTSTTVLHGTEPISRQAADRMQAGYVHTDDR